MTRSAWRIERPAQSVRMLPGSTTTTAMPSGPDHTLRAEQVDVDLVVQLVVAELFDRPDEAVPGRVDDDVEPSPASHGSRHRAVDLRADAHVGHQTDRIRRRSVERRRRGFVTEGRGHGVALHERGVDHGRADATRRAGDEPDLGHVWSFAPHGALPFNP